ncbi:2'-5' RNA ligase family protein, partial [Streptomyces sp. HCCB10043]|uniref:2'-5' RNA ligase family protein n=1 Tax=Streptomyces sp. HCCB10043 TaxID=1396518 RepID=UPI002D218574
MSSSDPGRPATQRLFAAVLPPDAAVAELRTALAPLHSLPGSRDLRWTGPEGWHFTLAFYGDVPEDATPELEARLERAARRTAPFALRVRGRLLVRPQRHQRPCDRRTGTGVRRSR